jgi:hypothetical protein
LNSPTSALKPFLQPLPLPMQTPTPSRRTHPHSPSNCPLRPSLPPESQPPSSK